MRKIGGTWHLAERVKEQEWEGQRDAPPEGIGFNNLRRSQRVWNTSTPAQFKVTA